MATAHLYHNWNKFGGTSTEYINITVIDVLPTSITYPLNNLNLTNNSVSSDLPLSPQITGAGEIVSWEIDGALPQGLNLNSITGEISEFQLSCGPLLITQYGLIILEVR